MKRSGMTAAHLPQLDGIIALEVYRSKRFERLERFEPRVSGA
jgi:hypothetical protein